MSRPAAPEPGLPAGVSEAARVYLRPVGLICGKAADKLAAAGRARPLADGPWWFAACEVVLRSSAGVRRASAALEDIEAWAGTLEVQARQRIETRLERLVAARVAPDGQPLTRPLVMGVVDLASDRLANRGPFDPEAAVAHGRRLAAAGADLLEVVGGSARHGPGAIAPEAEAARIVPVVRGLAELAGPAVSIDTGHAEAAAAALGAGAAMVSDGAVLTGGPRSLSAVAVLRGRRRDAAGSRSPAADGGEAAFEVFDRLEAQVEASLAAGRPHARLVVEPGIESGGTGGLAALRELALFHGLGCPVLVDLPSEDATGGPGRAAVLRALDQGAQILRTRDVTGTRRVLDLWRRLIASAE